MRNLSTMNAEKQKIATISVFAYDSIFVSDETAVTIVIIKIAAEGYPFFSAKEIAELREALRISLGSYADKLKDEDLSELGSTLLQATAVVLKAKWTSKKLPLKM